MSAPKFTPGPWRTEKIGSGQHVLNKGGYVVASIPALLAFPKAHDANARIIAAAPDIYEALRDIIGALNSGGLRATGNPGTKRDTSAALQSVRAALAKVDAP